MPYHLAHVTTDQDWRDYHAIRKAVLFADGPYDDQHADEYLPNHFPLLLKHEGSSVATARLDVIAPERAVIRLVAVAHAEQGKGHGRVLYQSIEHFARERGIQQLLVNAAPEALGYYQNLGFAKEIWDAHELQGIAEDCIQMRKALSA